ncbi:major capsid protein [Dipodfec virus UOA04_Rod_582]|nr:major capsid protein [Dipodfec virus UOA04_Rod_582]
MGVFSKSRQPEGRIKRNAFDGSFQNNLTMKMGYLYPCFCKEVIPGDTFEIDPAFGLRFMPTAFPLQTKIKAHMEFFYVRNRNLWDQFENYYFGTGQPDAFPVLSTSESTAQSRTGSLGDYLGIPSTIVGEQNVVVSASPFFAYRDVSPGRFGRLRYQIYIDGSTSDLPFLENVKGVSPYVISWFKGDSLDSAKGYSFSYSDLKGLPTKVFFQRTYVRLPQFFDASLYSKLCDSSGILELGLSTSSLGDFIPSTGSQPLETINVRLGHPGGNTSPNFVFEDGYVYLQKYESFTDSTNLLISLVEVDIRSGQHYYTTVDQYLPFTSPLIVYQKDTVYSVIEAMESLGESPIQYSALPFRAYEQIYNSFYRDDRNNPFMVNNVFDPNVFLPTTKGGLDSTPYRLRKRNWEQDFLTTALPSPQYGDAPLVGLTSSGVATFMDSDGNTYSSKLETAADGDTVVAFSSTESPQVNRQLVSLASTGISINDLRGVNSLQRYLETKFRIGLRYRDQMKAHFGIDISMDVLDMPEFIGAVTQSVDVSQINQTAPDSVDPLGSYAGQLSAVGGSSNTIRKYCDEPGYIIGIISVVPVPCYSQLLPKHFIKTNEPLDFYFPEFNHIGFQPIRYDEVCPFQASLANIPLDSTFGYQRAWYDYLSNVDEVHGQFRTTLNNFILSRVFNKVPSLNEDFLTIDPDSMNDVFTINEVDGEPVDTILGQIHFKVTMNRPISRFGVPRLE